MAAPNRRQHRSQPSAFNGAAAWPAARAQAASPIGASAPSAEADLLREERRGELLAAINGLPADDRLVIGARYFLELSEAETAALAGVAQGTVKSRLSRARRRLADALGQREEWLDD